MIALKKMNLWFAGLFLISANGIAQERFDIGTLISTSDQSRLAFEFRKPMGEQYKLRLGLTYGTQFDYFGSWANTEIVSASDSMVVERIRDSRFTQGGIRVGAERRFKTSMFSIGADLNVNYRNQRKQNFNRINELDEDGNWTTSWFDTDGAGNTILEDLTRSQITRHFLVPSLRVSFNMDIPLGKSFLLNLFVANSLGAPIYLGATDVNDPVGDFIGTPPSVIDFDTQFGAGLRYQIGKKE